MPFPRSLRSLLLLIGAAVGACLLAQFAAARTVDSGKPSFTLSTDGGEA